MRVVAFLIFVLLASDSFSSSEPPCLRCGETSCYCSRLSLRKVPAAPSELVAELDLSYNRLVKVRENDFLTFPSLRSLFMNNNRIKTIHNKAFLPLIRLEKLDLSENELDMLSPEWFKNLFSLQFLNLLGNKYTTLDQGLLQPLKSLKSLYVGGAFLHSVRRRDFSGPVGLEELVFDGKNLQLYANGSLSEIGYISCVTLGLNYMFERNQTLVQDILTDVVHPNTSLILTDTVFSTEHQMLPLKTAFDLGVTSVTFKNVNMSLLASTAFLNLMSDSKVTKLAFEDVQFFLRSRSYPVTPKSVKSLDVLFLKNVNIAIFYHFKALSFLEHLLQIVRKATIVNSKLLVIPCETSAKLTNLEFLDVSGNILMDLSLQKMMCDGNGGPQNLKTINVSENFLQVINGKLFRKFKQLRHIDLSRNKLEKMPESCDWPASLQFLNLSSNILTKVTKCLPGSLRILDLSRNHLTVFSVELLNLTELYISGNKIGHFPDGSLFPHLLFLSIHNNDLQTFSRNDLDAYKKLESLEARGSSYVCSCDFVTFMNKDLMSHRVAVKGEFESYICDSPDAVRHKRVTDIKLSEFECHKALFVSLLCSWILALFLLSAGLCYKFSVVWYLRMTCAWLKAKRKPKLKKGLLKYDAFVSYSEMDSVWVEMHLVPALEQSEPQLRLCLHNRDFVPGGLIQDNIMDAIEKSRKTLFILSRHFVRSEWCKYELDYSHFRLFDQNDDAVVLILLEPIDKDKIPKRFCRLRNFMNSRTYLEWPYDHDQIPVFWQNLRAVIRPPDIVPEYHKDDDVDP
ncbi:toll-like receptor 2 type-2 [Kryptolebias marmoratus]|uniref:toll-like receptor 2 type-2 n=1 Tax=Kryptolebias marmoratus TaxID=37003 RepID=UPI000D530EED|nr:toll-like receptor 2 type-2 [Kryptolebias marmoratus]